jgi:hypothetical protein
LSNLPVAGFYRTTLLKNVNSLNSTTNTIILND